MIEEYIEKYCKAREISEEKARSHATVKEVATYYREVIKDADGNGCIEKHVKPKGC